MVERRVPRSVVLVVLASLLAAALVPIPPAAASATVAIMEGVLPSARDGTSAVRAGPYLYIFGGDDGTRSNAILRYDPATDTMVTMGATLPSGRSGTSAIYDGTNIYIFGGWATSGYTDQIVRYDPVSDTTTVMSGKLPTPRYYTSAVWTGSAALIFGGGVSASPGTTNQIVRYVPTTDTVTITNATFPTTRYGTSAVWNAPYAYIFGGVNGGSGTEKNEIVRYDPTTGNLVVLGSTLPSARYHTSATWHTSRAYVFGGYGCNPFPHYCKQVVEFDPATGSVSVLGVELPSARMLTSAAANNTHAFVFGGNTGTPPRTNQTVRFGPPVLPPPPNSAPTIDAIGSIAIVADLELNVTVAAHDVDNDPLTLSIAPLPANGTFTDHGNGTATFLWLTNETDVGVHSFTVTANDGEATATRSFTITVTGDPPPVIDPIDDETKPENTHLVIHITASDPEGQPVRLYMPVRPANATFTDGSTGVGTLDWWIGYDAAGVHDLTVWATDNITNVSSTFRVTVTNVDRAPIFSPTGPGTAIEAQAFQMGVSATDLDNEPITLTASGLPAGSAFIDHGDGTGSFVWTPPGGSVGAYSILVTAVSGSGSASQVLSFSVVRAVDFRLSAVGSVYVKASPEQTIQLPVRVSNVGGTDDTYSFTAFDLSTESGWIVQAPAPVSVAAGSFKIVNVTVTVPADGALGKPRLVGTSSEGGFTRLLNWQVEVPVYLTIVQDNDEPSVADLSLLAGITGNVVATWQNGAPAIGVDVDVAQHPDGRPQLTTTVSGATDATGTFEYDFGPDPLALLPGDHILTATVERNGRVYSASDTYTVSVAF